ncbi:MAG: hypothetical protein ABIN36_00075 [Ferruginibacter sp.]
MKLNFFLISIALLFLLASCKKNDAINNNNDNNSTSSRLKQYVAVNGQDTLIKFTYSYDSENRIVESQKLLFQSGLQDYNVITHFIYNGNDSLPARANYSEVDLTGADPVYNYSEHFYYTGSGLLFKDSIARPSLNPLVYNFSYFPDHFTVITNFRDTIYAHQNIINGNISNEIDTVFGYSTSPLYVNDEFHFDDYKNPFQYTEVPRPLIYMPENFIQDFETPAFKNNPISIHLVTTGSNLSETNTTYTYSYNAEGYPVTAHQQDEISGENVEGFYYYE